DRRRGAIVSCLLSRLPSLARINPDKMAERGKKRGGEKYGEWMGRLRSGGEETKVAKSKEVWS
ncbi:hypothetical protein CRG98_013935, partial [Punica granatum]